MTDMSGDSIVDRHCLRRRYVPYVVNSRPTSHKFYVSNVFKNYCLNVFFKSMNDAVTTQREEARVCRFERSE